MHMVFVVLEENTTGYAVLVVVRREGCNLGFWEPIQFIRFGVEVLKF